MSTEEGIRRSFADALGADIVLGDRVLVACSGGGDSIALLHLAQRALGEDRVAVATVNHNLRDTGAELALVARHAAGLGVPHHVMDWHWDGKGNLQAAAREARRGLLSAHAEALQIDHILLGHTRDDQAETFIMRLARGSGVDGLAAMQTRDGQFFRPLLHMTREDLRGWLRAEGLDWAEDPSNTDPRFDRVRARAMMDQLGALGLTADRLVATAELMAEERRVLVEAARDFGRRHSVTQDGDIMLEAADFWSLPPSLATRVLAGLVLWFSDTAYKPRSAELSQWKDRLAGGKPAPLGGVLACADGDHLRFFREAAAVQRPVPVSETASGTIWDRRWTISHPTGQRNTTITALGAELGLCGDWQDHPLPRASLEMSPALWQDGSYRASLLFDPPAGWSLRTTEWWRTLK